MIEDVSAVFISLVERTIIEVAAEYTHELVWDEACMWCDVCHMGREWPAHEHPQIVIV